MRAAVAALLVLLASPAVARAEPQLVPVGTFAEPVHIAAPPGDAARLFVVEQAGRVQLVAHGQKGATPFLDLTGTVNHAGGEEGLLSIAFAPDYAASGLFYVFYTDAAGDLVVAEGARSASDPDRGALRRVVFTVPHPGASNHNGGQLAFGPDGGLYASTGDGGGQGDPGDDAQRLDSLLGKILRIDPRSGEPPAIWALGLRNPWRFSFDHGTGTMVIGDVGGSRSEEIDIPPVGVAFPNFGWSRCEGVQGECAGTVPPVLDMPRTAGYTGVIGGFVVRDAGLPTLLGRYLFADLGKGTLLSAALGSGVAPRAETSLPLRFASSFGEDSCGRLYVASLATGVVARIQDGDASPCPGPAPPPPEPTPTPPGVPAAAASPPPSGTPADTSPCALRVGVLGPQRIVRRGAGLRIALRADEPCVVTVRARRFSVERGVDLQPGVTRIVRLAPTERGLRRLRRAKARSEHGRVVVRVRIRAVDAAGNQRAQRVVRRVR